MLADQAKCSYTFAVDIYSFGLVLLECYTGVHPFDKNFGMSYGAVLSLHRAGFTPSIPPDCPESYALLVVVSVFIRLLVCVRICVCLCKHRNNSVRLPAYPSTILQILACLQADSSKRPSAVEVYQQLQQIRESIMEV